MRIISSFRDYYDIPLAFGQDADTVYVRKTFALGGQLAKPFIPTERLDSLERTGRHYLMRTEPFVVHFCGQRFAGLRIITMPFGDAPPRADFFAYQWETAVAVYQSMGVDLFKERFWRWRRGWEDVKAWMVDAPSPRMLEMGAAIIAVTRDDKGDWKAELNPFLKPLEFYRVMPPYQAFQELSMWIGGTLPAKDADMATVADRDRIAQHGFDKWSFRKQPEGKGK